MFLVETTKGEKQNCSIHGPPFLLIHQDWLFFSRQKYNPGQTSRFKMIYKSIKLLERFFFFFYGVNGVLGWKSFCVTHCDTVTTAQALGRTKVQIVKRSDLSKQP